MKANITDEELLQEIQNIIDKASLTEQIALTDLLQRYELAVSVAKLALPRYPLGVLDFFATVTRFKGCSLVPVKQVPAAQSTFICAID
ncbi:hypothetical protein KQE47_06690 [Raoultella planticola]|uniref:hypothetical protein n=1 Tax=Raoultella planticola TaxID=575 RepID=UPI00223B5A24|nr:hypothetical protein [Raoultella planticola]MCS7490292.1 hypothetical protein [Raoultella planticola]MDC3908045.1 hypothetical protein [Raoultella planticola]